MEAHATQAHALLGDHAGAARALERAWARVGARPPAWHEAPRLAMAAAWTQAAGGEPTRAAQALLEHAVDMDEWPLLQALVLQESLSLGGQPAGLARALRAACERCDAPRAQAAARHAAALAQDDAAGLGAAAAELADIGAWLAGAEAAFQAAAAYEGEGRTFAARRVAALGARLLARCEGASTPALRAAGPASAQLTRREREIAELVFRGLSWLTSGGGGGRMSHALISACDQR